VRARPTHAKAHNNLGVILREQGQVEQARAAFEQALAHEPRFGDAAFNLAGLLQAQVKLHEALPWFEQATQFKPGFAPAWLHLGQVLVDIGRLPEAEQAMRRALALDPDYAGAWNDLGLLLTELNRTSEGVAALERAVALMPHSDPFKTNLGLLLMQAGDLGRAWNLYEHRWYAEGQVREAYRYDPALEWDGGSLQGKRLRVWWEQGLGDTLCFTRYLPQVAARFHPQAISLEVQPGLGALMAHSWPGVEVIEQGASGPPWDVQVPLMSLPARCAISAGTAAAREPYLAPTPQAAAKWRERLAQVPGPRIGICWGAGLWATGIGLERRWRSVDPASFEQLLGVPGVSFISLQKGARAEHAQRWARQPGFYDWTADIADFNDTAALMAGLDLVITVDTSVTHLAGALGKPTWVLLRFEGGNLWNAGESPSLWYPQFRIFRQTRQGQWGDVMQRATQALRDYAAKGNA